MSGPRPSPTYRQKAASSSAEERGDAPLLRGDGPASQGEGPVFAVDNRCPHEGYALAQGDKTSKVLTCAWHDWKFRLTDGKCLFGGENVRTYPVQIRGGDVFVDVTDPAPETIAPQLFASLLEAMGDVNVGRLARDTMRLRRIGTPLAELVREGVSTAPRAEYTASKSSLATLTDCLGIAAAFEGSLQALPVIQGLSVVSQTEVRRPERPPPRPGGPGRHLRLGQGRATSLPQGWSTRSRATPPREALLLIWVDTRRSERRHPARLPHRDHRPFPRLWPPDDLLPRRHSSSSTRSAGRRQARSLARSSPRPPCPLATTGSRICAVT